MNELVSIIIPTYKRSHMLDKTINNALKQTYKNIEIVIVDDNGSSSVESKKVEEVMNKYSDFSNIIYVKNEYNLGAAEARNVGIRTATGKYIAFLDDDDLCTIDRIKRQVDVFVKNNNEKLALVYCYSKVISDGKYKKDYVYQNNLRGNCIYGFMCDGNIAATSQWLCRKDILIKMGGFITMPSKEESELMFRILLNGYEIDYVPEVLIMYNMHGEEHVSGNVDKSSIAEDMILSKCRKEYWRLSFIELLKVEYSFASRKYRLYKSNGYHHKAKEEFSIMKKISFFCAFKESISTNLRLFKHYVFD